MRIILLLCGVAAGILGCGGPTGTRDQGPFRITTDHSLYVFGSAVSVGVRNVSRTPQVYNFCPITLERFENGGWTLAGHFPADGACGSAVRGIFAAGDSVGFVFQLPQTPMMGSYRLVLPWMGDMALAVEKRATPPFSINCPICQ